MALAFVASGCRVSASANANLNTGKKSEEFEDEPPVQGQDQADQLPNEYALLGARHDLSLAADKRSAVCSCLAVALGSPGDAAFKWEGPAPAIDAETQLVIALTSEGVACDKAKPDQLGASYWGYKLSGDDVIVTIENAKNGRPVTAGAIIPKPVGNGQVYVRPASKAVPYGRPLQTSDKVCKVGNPGPARTIANPTPETDDDW
ncbi:MAG: hypothetical protein U0263_22620 [Polyangiaceae bacterium]